MSLGCEVAPCIIRLVVFNLKSNSTETGVGDKLPIKFSGKEKRPQGVLSDVLKAGQLLNDPLNRKGLSKEKKSRLFFIHLFFF